MASIVPGRLALATVVALSFSVPQPERDGEVLVSLSGEDRVVAFLAGTGAMFASFPTGAGPHEIALSPDRRLAYVANSGSASGTSRPRTVSVLDLSA